MKGKNEENHKQAKEISKKILIGIGLTAMAGGLIIFPGAGAVIALVEKLAKEYSREKARAAFQRMKRRGTVKVSIGEHGAKLILTEKGKKLISRYKLADLKIIQPAHWNGKWQLVMFDVPESRRTVRNLVRIKLLHLGFAAIQKSVFIHPYNCDEVIDFLRGYYHLDSGELYIFEARVKEGEKALKKHFDL